LTFLIFCEENNIIASDDVPKFEYYLDGNKHRYTPDYFIESENLVVEIKSTYWYNCWEMKNIEKANVVLNSKYKYIMILDNNFEMFKNRIMKKK